MNRLRRPHTTVRWKLTLVYGGLFLVCGAGLLAITYALVANATVVPPDATFIARAGKIGFGKPLLTRSPQAGAAVQTFRSLPVPTNGQLPNVTGGQTTVPEQIRKLINSKAGNTAVRQVVRGQQISDLHQLELWSGIALAIMAVISGGLGWLVAGRVLRPLRTITTATQQISEENLHERLAMSGPRDELKKLADTIDGLLGRLEGAFDAQRRFVANASHELRTPLTAARALLEMTLSDPEATVQTFRRTCRQALEENEQQEQLIDALLALAQGQRGVDQREPVDLATLTSAVLKAHEFDAAAEGLQVEASLTPAVVVGDPRLIERLVSNLVENAIRHNVHGGRLQAQVEGRDRQAAIRISNTGPVIPADDVERLLQPFQRLAPDRLSNRDGIGLGLSIVAAIANAHGAALHIQPGEQGGLSVEVRFMAPPPASGTAPRGELPAQPPARREAYTSRRSSRA